MSFIVSFINSLPSAVTQGMIWGIMAMGVYITYKILDIADMPHCVQAVPSVPS